MPGGRLRPAVQVTVEVAGAETHTLEAGPETTYADLLAAVDISPQAVAVLVDGRPVPEDRAVESDHVRVVRLVRGG